MDNLQIYICAHKDFKKYPHNNIYKIITDKDALHNKYDDKLNNPSGKRKYRGLYVTKTGLKLNSDINGSLNILRKYLKCNSDELITPADVGFVVNPVKIKLNT